MSNEPNTIVAEISKNWFKRDERADGPRADLLSNRFELVIQANAERGYELDSWRLDRVFIPAEGGIINETIIAVFVKPEEADE